MSEIIDDDQTEAVAALLLSSVNAPEREIYQTARSIVVMLSRDAEIERLKAALLDERDAIANKTREIAAYYPYGSDGQNTFIILAEWIEARAAIGEEGKG